jgi:hypothetical protein
VGEILIRDLARCELTELAAGLRGVNEHAPRCYQPSIGGELRICRIANYGRY